MAHVRKQIRDRVESVLSDGVTLVSGRVYASRLYPLTGPQLPAVAVYTNSEASDVQAMGMGSRTFLRDLSLVVDVYARVTDTFDDDIDALCVQIEEAIAADCSLNGLAKDAILNSTEIDFDSEAEKPVGVARLTYAIRYVTTIGDVETAR